MIVPVDRERTTEHSYLIQCEKSNQTSISLKFSPNSEPPTTFTYPRNFRALFRNGADFTIDMRRGR